MKKSQLHGKRVTCKILREEITDAKLSVGKESVFVCQNKVEGASCEEKFGYKHSWWFADKDDIKKAKELSDLNDLNEYKVTDLKFVETRGRKKKQLKGKTTNFKTASKVLKTNEILSNYKKVKENYLSLTQDNKEQVILILLEEGYKVWEKEGLLYFERAK